MRTYLKKSVSEVVLLEMSLLRSPLRWTTFLTGAPLSISQGLKTMPPFTKMSSGLWSSTRNMSIVSKTTTVKSRQRMPQISQTFNMRQTKTAQMRRTKTVVESGPDLRARASVLVFLG